MKKLLFALGIAFLLLGSLQHLNAALMCITMGAGRSVLGPLSMAGAFALAALLLWFASARAHQGVTSRFVAATFLCVVAVGYAAYLAFVPVHRFGSAATGTPFEVIEENYPLRGVRTYRMNASGFRGPAWDEGKTRGTVRGVLIGDSMVFGSGVDDGDTIDAMLTRRLRATHPGTAVEILNLGVQGSNLPAYVELYRAVTQRLAPDFVVLFLFLPNDLGELEQPSQADRFGAYSFFTFLLGTNSNPYTHYAMRASDARSDASKLEFRARHVQAIDAIRRSQASTPLFVFLYRIEDPRWIETLRMHLGDGARVVDHAPLPDADFIPGDGHPTAEGNRHFAALIGDAIDRAGGRSVMIAFAVASAALVLAVAVSLQRPEVRTLAHPAMLGAIVLFVASMVVRTLSVQPTLVHADVVAPELVDCVLESPRVCTTRGASYGQYGFLFLGTLTRPFGNDLNAVFRAMAIVGALNVALLAVLAHRLSGSPYGALFAVAVTGTNPVFMRVAGSEDMHNVGLLLALVALVAMDVFAVARRMAPLVAAVLALCLLIHTRQTFHVVAPCAFVLGLARGGRDLLKDARFWAAGLVVVAVLVNRVAANAAASGLVQQMAGIFAEPVLLPTILRHHTLLDVARFGLLPVLTAAAVIWACFDGRVARATALAFALNFVVTYPCGMPSPGVEFAQRLSVVAFGALLVAIAGAAVLENRVPQPARAVAGLSGAAVLMAVPPFFPGWHVLGVRTPIHQEYLAVESAAAKLPQAFTLVKVPTAEATVHGHARYAGLLERQGKRVHVVESSELTAAPRPWVFLEDIECWTYSFRELTGATDDHPTGRMSEFRWDKVLFGRQASSLRPPAGPRPECRPFQHDGTPIGPRVVIPDPADDPPFLFYAGGEVPIQFYELRPTGAK